MYSGGHKYSFFSLSYYGELFLLRNELIERVSYRTNLDNYYFKDCVSLGWKCTAYFCAAAAAVKTVEISSVCAWVWVEKQNLFNMAQWSQIAGIQRQRERICVRIRLNNNNIILRRPAEDWQKYIWDGCCLVHNCGFTRLLLLPPPPPSPQLTEHRRRTCGTHGWLVGW